MQGRQVLADGGRPVFTAFDGLRVGATLELQDTRELGSLQILIEATRPSCYHWQERAAAPGETCVRITKTPMRGGGADCPCQCGGALLDRAAC